jgi:sugar/nucleoside kinase (ribokinase family)
MSIIVVGTIGYDTVETQHGGVTDALGGSASFFALAARFFSPVSIVAVVGSDFKPEHMQLFVDRNIDVRGLVRREGPTFRWHGRYHEDMNIRDTVNLALNVFADFRPELLPDQRRSDYIFLANISPDLQTHVLEQVASPKIVAADTMNHWIANERQELIKLLPRLDILTVNDEEARMLSGEHNLVKAGRAILKMGPDTVLVKRGEYGVLQFSRNSLFAVPAYPLEEVVDPTGAGDAFAGAFMG